MWIKVTLSCSWLVGLRNCVSSACFVYVQHTDTQIDRPDRRRDCGYSKDLELLVGAFEELYLLGVLLLVHLTLLGGRSLRLLELQLELVQLALQVLLVVLHLLDLHVADRLARFYFGYITDGRSEARVAASVA